MAPITAPTVLGVFDFSEAVEDFVEDDALVVASAPNVECPIGVEVEDTAELGAESAGFVLLISAPRPTVLLTRCTNTQ